MCTQRLSGEEPASPDAASRDALLRALGMALAVEQAVARDPIQVGLLGAIGIVFQPQHITNRVEEFFGGWLLQGTPGVF